MRPSQALKQHRSEVLNVIARYQLSNPRIFGSVARGEDREDSDIDILVDYDSPISTFKLAELELALEAILNTRVDVRLPSELSIAANETASRDMRPI
ncbi:nucleotidyltransferase [Aliihoeflea aestuarii]|jgi:uncharacterized protein|uniref:nucleotidyltransferase family protein n=1 Tax=Aliihoeflea aestuarii TaxID=453840 RepID=UPI0020923FF2|nr:nucleotidyltransferase domain-containing protein [Aliihoeflea aestuarii]MCO6390469.1 nucleotidyltransferase [Aliihoeflea aestuarii]